ncbi:peptidase M4 [Sporolactobacillus sp. THM7-7]|nr:peptidase M4 [Sporolactobacillus sp. THM7-7]
MKKWIMFILLAVLISGISGSWYVYGKNANYHEQIKQAAVKKAKQRFHIENAESVSYYHGTESYYVIKGKTAGKQMYYWIPDKKKGKYIERRANSGMTRKEALSTLSNMHLDVQEVLAVRLGAIGGKPIWEITFLNSQKKYNYVSIFFDNGKEAQRILNI